MRRVPAILIVVFLACPLLFASFIVIAVSTWTLDRNFSLSLLDDERLFKIPDAVSSASWSGVVIDGLGGLQWKSVGRAAGAVLTPEYMRSQAVRIVNQVFDSFDGTGGRFDISIDTTPVKAALRGDAGGRFARLLAEDLPVGGSAADFRVERGRLPATRPSTVSVDRAAAMILSGLPAFVNGIPDTVRLSDGPSIRIATNPWGGGPRFHIFGALLAASIITLLFAAGFWMAAAFIGGETRYERLQWLGWSLLAPAAGVLLLGLLITLSSFAPWMRWGIGISRLQPLGFDASFISALIDAARRVVARVGIGFLATGGIAAGVSLGLLAWSWSIPHDERKGVTT
jgi:hypothetical protein